MSDGEVVPLRAVPDEAETGPPEAAPAGPPGPPVLIGTVVPGDPGDRRPVIPAPLRRENLRGTVAAFAGTQWHRSRYHGLRFPLYVAAHVFWALVGACRGIARLVAWWWVTEQADLRSDAVIAGDSKEWMRLHKEAKEDRLRRGLILLGCLAAVAIAASFLGAYGHWWIWAPTGMAVVLLLARAGRPDGVRIIGPAIAPAQYEPPTESSITVALGSLGIAAISKAIKDGPGIRFISPVMRDGPGWGVQLDLPFGVTATQILARRESLASGLRRPLSATWPATVPAEHAGRLELWVGFHDISKAKPPKWPLAKTGTVDVFDGVPFGTDPRQRPVIAPLFEVNWLIGAAPGQGKTGAVRVVNLGAALDPLAVLWVHELAGKGDLEPLAQVSHRYVSGLDDESIAYAAESARMLRADVERRARQFKRLPPELKPRHGKITRELSLRYLDLRPLVATFDEAQNLFMHPELGEQAADDLAYVIRLGRAFGIIVVLATQRPDGVALPTRIRGIVTARFCLKVPDYDSNDMILGTGAYKAGYNAAIFRAKTDAGLGWLKADGDPQIVRTYYLDDPASKRICDRARAMRERAGVLSGYALGLDDEPAVPRDVLGDLAEVFGDDSGMHWGIAAIRLAERFPDRWADATAEALSAQCRALGVKSVDVRMDGNVLKGCRRVAVEAAMQ